jgi:hypothetical protein
MPVIHDISLDLNTEEILRREGFRGYAKARPKLKNLLAELLESVRSSQLLQPAAACEIYPVTSINPDRVFLDGDAAVNGPLIPSNFPDAKELAITVCTIGPGLEERVTEYSQNGDTLRAMMLDGIGSAAVDTLAQEICRYISHDALSRGLQASSPVNPGMPGLDIREQWNILELAGAGEIGVNLTSSGIMVPRKSTSLVNALGTKAKTWTQAEVCARCNLRETCPYCSLPG